MPQATQVRFKCLHFYVCCLANNTKYATEAHFYLLLTLSRRESYLPINADFSRTQITSEFFPII